MKILSRVKNILFPIIGFVSFEFAFATSTDSTIYQLQDSLLELHSIRIERHDSAKVKLMTGNGDMGGMLNRDGLGFDQLWVAEFWKNTTDKHPLNNLRFISDSENIRKYSQVSDLKTGIISTEVLSDNNEYQTEVFFSKSTKELLVMRIKNLRSDSFDVKLELPVNRLNVENGGHLVEFESKEVNKNIIVAANPDTSFTRLFWVAWSSEELKPTSTYGTYNVAVPGSGEIVFVFSVATHWQGEDFANRALNSFYSFNGFDYEKKTHKLAWENEWRKTAIIKIPDVKYERLFYRSVYYTFCSAASERFLPGEAQFAVPSWEMRPYSYGAAGWSVRSFALLGHEDKAKEMAKKHFVPLALKSNARKYISYIKNNQYEKFWEYPPVPEQDVSYYFNEGIDSLLLPSLNETSMGFAHQLSILNDCRIRRAHQRGINAFAAAFFHQISEYYPDEVFTRQYTYPVMKGTANFWEVLLEWNDSLKSYILPKLHSVSENITQESILDCAVAAKWNLMMASAYAKKLGLDEEKRRKWQELSDNIYIPQNDTIYLEYLNDRMNREGSGYFGIRAPVYLGFPGYELIPLLDEDKVKNTLDLTWQRNLNGKGMISFIASWFGITEAYFGRGNECVRYLERNIQCVDESEIALFEFENNKPYFQTSYAAYIQLVLSMIIQSYNDTIRVFPAIPDSWKNLSFYNIHVEDGISVSGNMNNGEIDFIILEKEGKLLLDKKNTSVIRINDL